MIGRVVRVFAATALLVSGCESTQIDLVAETDDVAADFGRSSLREAVAELSKTPNNPEAYEKFSSRVYELMPFFSRTVKRDAELRLSTLAIAPLEAGLTMSPEEQMKAFATTVWPTILEFPKQPSETTDVYIGRLCASEFALDCNNVVPERWPEILNAKVWRALKSRVGVAYGRCRWCEEDASFAALIERSRTIHRRLELVARRAKEGGTPGDWPLAGPNAKPLGDEVVITFEGGGRVTVGGRVSEGGDWRGEIREIRGERRRVALHLAPDRLVADLLQVLGDVRVAGYEEVALVARHREYPYEPGTYAIDARVRTSRALDVHNGDTIQILVQALDHQQSSQEDE